MYDLQKDKIIGVAALDKCSTKGHINTMSIDRLCEYLYCQSGNLMEHVPILQRGTYKSEEEVA